MDSVALVLLAFLSGSLPMSIWLGKALLNKDIRQYGDGNPGATNVFRAGNRIVGLLALLLDVSKAALPVGAAYFNLGIRGLPMFLIATAPVLGHIFSPFLRFKGGKAVATVLGVWIGLTLWKASLAGVLFVLIGMALFSVPGYAVLTGLAGILVALVIWMPDPLFFAVLGVQFLLMAWTHRHDLHERPRPPVRPILWQRRVK